MKDTSIKIEVFHLPPSRSDRVMWAINELGLESNTTATEIDLLKGENKTAEMKEMNPLMQVPTVILTNGEGVKRTVTESCAIPAILSEICDDKLSPPRDNIMARATYHRVNMMCASNLDFMGTAVYFNEKIAPEEIKDMEAAAKGRADFKSKGAVVIKQILGDSQYICGPDYDEFTMADISLCWLLFLCDDRGMLDDEPVLKAYLDRCLARPAWKKLRSQD